MKNFIFLTKFNFNFIAITVLFVTAYLLEVRYTQSIGYILASIQDIFSLDVNLIGCAGAQENDMLHFFSLPVKPSRLTNEEKSKFHLTETENNILVGLILGDLYLMRQGVNARLCFKQSIIHKDYLYHLYDLFNTYCCKPPVTTNTSPDKRTGNIYNSVYFNTYSLPCFNEPYDLFYPNGTKVVPLNIGDLLTPLGLCYWMSDDGCFCKTTHRVTLSTHSFALAEVELLMSVLEDKFGLKCVLDKQAAGNRIRISAKSLPHLRNLLLPHMPSMMLYKLGL